jgi:cystathionine beta-lyase
MHSTTGSAAVLGGITREKTGRVLADDQSSLERLFGSSDDLLPLWIAEPYLPLAPPVLRALEVRSQAGWYGYEIRPQSTIDLFRSWMQRRHGWELGDAHVLTSPSIGTSIGAALEIVTKAEGAVILQPPVFTDFKPLVAHSHAKVSRNSLLFEAGHYSMDLDGLEAAAAEPGTEAMILCNPHNPVGRVWRLDELASVADICASHNVFVISDEIHADITLGESEFVPFAVAAQGTGVRWAALHGPIKTFGLAGVADTLIVTDDDDFAGAFKAMSSRLHLTRNSVFSLAASAAAYAEGDDWLDSMLAQVSENVSALANGLPDSIDLVAPEGTYLAWLDFRGLGMDVPTLGRWLPEKARLALSPGHWFGKEGAGFARMSIAVEPLVISEAINRLTVATG